MPRQTNFRKIEVNPDKDLLVREELAWCLRVHRSYVSAMVSCGFPMPAGTATLTESRNWIIQWEEQHGRKFTRKEAGLKIKTA